MKPINTYIQQKLQQRRSENNFRKLKPVEEKIDFTSNDYLGFARNNELKECIKKEVAEHAAFHTGSTGSRLLSGNSAYAEDLENEIAQFHHAETALIFNSGFDANYGLLSTLPYKGDTIIYDELVHASVHDGIRNSRAAAVSFNHNNVEDLELKLQKAEGLKYVVVESVYSMDGDFSPLQLIAELCLKYDAGLIVDEAHATGIFGKNGKGRVTELGLEKWCLARVHTYGKAMGTHGAALLCSSHLKEFMVNYCRPFIYSTALPFYSLAAIKCAYKFLPVAGENRNHIFSLIKLFKNGLSHRPFFRLTESNSPIQSIIIAGNSPVKEFAEALQKQGYDVRPILAPTVPKGSERIRICLHSFNTADEVVKLVQTINGFEAAVSR